jgi:hypothetical protein
MVAGAIGSTATLEDRARARVTCTAISRATPYAIRDSQTSHARDDLRIGTCVLCMTATSGDRARARVTCTCTAISVSRDRLATRTRSAA